ncbi:lytic transglycosylase [Micractinium conductrix]|uniref:Lytic transglycosylase n=1 Tax=Micractinium conductrix TaxID=554055 RepID=A0A2P6VKR0_9CHLO|nr:lytic transglycosylase [Micractinium conductrix]|eukprot:PSC74647.1 lytic transglycosylase [Micractinium conductrix]
MVPRALLAALCLAVAVQAMPTEKIAAEYGFCPKYTVQTGDTLFDIGKKLGVETADLTAATEACKLNIDLLQIGQAICLPGYNVTICDDVVRTDPDRPYCQVYIVKEGDTTAKVAAKFGLKEDEFVKLNSDYLNDGYTLPVAGQYVRLPGWNQAKCRDFNDNDLPNCQVYTVVAGDSARDIAQKYKVDLDAMLELNGLNYTDALPLNFKLKLPEWNASCPADGIPAVLPADTVDCRVTTLGTGQTLASLAEKYMTSLNALLAVNPALTNATLLQPGTFVLVPPFPAECLAKANLVDVPGTTTLPANFDYNGYQGGSKTPSPAVSAPVAAPAPEAAPTPVAAPSPEPTPSPQTAPLAPEPVPAPGSAAAPAAAAASLAVAAVALLAGALAL